MVWAAIASERGDEFPMAFIDDGVKVNKQVYLNMLQEELLPWLTETFEYNHISNRTVLQLTTV